MPTEQPTLKIRRATPLDAVNLFRILVDEEQNTGSDVEFDEAARLAHILNVIATGYVAVAEKSGRLVGTIGFSAGGAPYAKSRVLTSEWYFLIPSLQNSRVPVHFVDRIVGFADKHKVAISFSGLSHATYKLLADVLVENHFGTGTLTVVRAADGGTDDQGTDDTQEDAGNEPDVSDEEDSDPTEPV